MGVWVKGAMAPSAPPFRQTGWMWAGFRRLGEGWALECYPVFSGCEQQVGMWVAFNWRSLFALRECCLRCASFVVSYRNVMFLARLHIGQSMHTEHRAQRALHRPETISI
jgi:hypothetical protein